MSLESAPVVDAAELIRLVGPTYYGRGRDYARAGAVLSTQWEPGSGVLSGLVQGSDPRPYRCVVLIGATGASRRPLSGSCSCPVGFDCKHVAALVLASNEDAARALLPHAPRVPAIAPQSMWKRSLGLAIESPAPERAGIKALGLQFELRAQKTSSWRGSPGHDRRGLVAPTSTPSAMSRLAVRPVLKSDAGNWVRSGVGWGELSYLGNRERVDPAQLAWLLEFLALSRSTTPIYYSRESEWIVLDDFTSPLLWTLFARGGPAGIALIAGKGAEVEVVVASVRLELRRAGDGMRLETRLEFGGQPLEPGSVAPIGDHGVYLAERASSSALTRVRLAPLPSAQLAILQNPATLLVPAHEIEEFFFEYYPRLRHTVDVVSGDDTLQLPEIVPPTLVITVIFEPRQTLSWSLGWSGMRDAEVEQGIMQPVGPMLPTSTRLVGLEAAEFAAETVPQLEQLDGVRVEFVGDRPDYREVHAPPQLKVSTIDTGERDWFDLGVTVTVDGNVVPFVELFTALSHRQTRLLLVDHSYLSLEQPMFDELRELIAEASNLGEWQTGLRISRYQASLWSEFEDLADETEQAVAWRATASGLLGDVETVPAPPGLVAELRPYQQQGFEWLVFLWRNRLGGILADDMGLGKTLQTLALVAQAVESRGSDDGHPFLVVAPTSVVANWAVEATRFAPGLAVRTVTTTQAKGGVPLSELAVGADVVVTSYALFRLDFNDYQSLEWAGLILDEAQFVKNAASRAHECAVDLRAPFKLAITGTPLENSLTDLWALLRITAPGLFPSARRFREEYVRPIGADGAGLDGGKLLARLRSRIRPLMLRRTKELVATELPAKQEQLLRVELAPRHRKLYELTLQRERQKLLGLIEDLDRNRFIVFRSLTLLRMLSLDAALIDDKHADIPSAKLDALLEQLDDVVSLGHRALVFSQFTSFLKRAAARLDEAAISYEYLDGATRRRPQVIERFRSGDAPVFLISLKAGGFGLNLTEADYVFLLDPWWNPATEAQAIDRTHRIGQTRSVNVYRLIASGTIEEKVMALRDGKAQLFDAVVDEGAVFGAALTAADIRGLLEG